MLIGSVYGLLSEETADIDDQIFYRSRSGCTNNGFKDNDHSLLPTNHDYFVNQYTWYCWYDLIYHLSNGVTPVDSMNPNEQVEINFMTAAVSPTTQIYDELRPSVGARLPFARNTPDAISRTYILS